MADQMKRSRLIYLFLTGGVIALGLLSRRYPGLFPAALGKYPGDALWAMMVFCGLGCLFPGMTTRRAGGSALAFSCAVEFSQLYHAPWIESLRDTLPGRLVLGRGFSWVDMGAYAIGLTIACLGEIIFQRFHSRKD